MAQTTTNIVISLFFNILSSLIISSGFRLKLTHWDSPNSPLYQSNLSDFERFNKNVEISKSRASYLHQFKLQNASLRVPLAYIPVMYTVDIGLGTPAVKRTLIFDTGSDVAWTQCTPCIKCFDQKQPLFNTKNSTSYRLMSKRNKLSRGFECNTTGCFYRVQYYNRWSSSGVMAVEDFTFGRIVANLAFGCGTTNVGDFNKMVTGILGMDKEPASFARQLGARIKHRFSYCLTKNNTRDSYLTFGEEAVIKGGNARSTPFLRTRPNAQYVLKLKDISIGGQKLGLSSPERCVVDSGCSFSILNERAFLKVERFLTVYFSRFKNVRRLVSKEIPKEMICYSTTSGGTFGSFPNMTYHFKGADFDVPWDNSFWWPVGKEVFCFAAKKCRSDQNITVLGAYQQRNMRIVYDLKADKLLFAPDDCSRDVA